MVPLRIGGSGPLIHLSRLVSLIIGMKTTDCGSLMSVMFTLPPMTNMPTGLTAEVAWNRGWPSDASAQADFGSKNKCEKKYLIIIITTIVSLEN